MAARFPTVRGAAEILRVRGADHRLTFFPFSDLTGLKLGSAAPVKSRHFWGKHNSLALIRLDLI